MPFLYMIKFLSTREEKTFLYSNQLANQMVWNYSPQSYIYHSNFSSVLIEFPIKITNPIVDLVSGLLVLVPPSMWNTPGENVKNRQKHIFFWRTTRVGTILHNVLFDLLPAFSQLSPSAVFQWAVVGKLPCPSLFQWRECRNGRGSWPTLASSSRTRTACVPSGTWWSWWVGSCPACRSGTLAWVAGI